MYLNSNIVNLAPTFTYVIKHTNILYYDNNEYLTYTKYYITHRLINFFKSPQFYITYFKYFKYVYLNSLKFSLSLRSKLIHKRRKRIYKVKLKIKTFDLLINLFKSYNFIKLKTFKVKKMKFSQPYNHILKSRRLLRILLFNSKVRSAKLTKWLSLFFKKKISSSIYYKNYLVGTILINSGLVLNLLDAYYFIKNGLIIVNSKPISSFYKYIYPNDIINLVAGSFFINYFTYYKTVYVRWLQKKKRKNSFKLRKYINKNKVNLKITQVLKRWLFSVRWGVNPYSLFEVDYRVCTIYCFFKVRCTYAHDHIFKLLSPSSILNLWYYSF